MRGSSTPDRLDHAVFEISGERDRDGLARFQRKFTNATMGDSTNAG
jgi:hypothetical protein